MSKQWWSSRAGFAVQGGCLLALFAWSVVHRAPTAAGRAQGRAAASEAVIDNSEDAVVADNDAAGRTDARFEVPPAVRFRTDHPAADLLNPRPVEEPSPERPTPRQPARPARRLPDPGTPRTPFEVSGSGATVYNAPPPDAD